MGHLLEGTERTAVAVKMLPEAPDSVTENLEAEIAILAHATIRCAHVCRLIGTCVVEGTCALVMKLYECSLHDLLEGAEQRKLPLEMALQARPFLRSLSTAVWRRARTRLTVSFWAASPLSRAVPPPTFPITKCWDQRQPD